MKVMNASEGKVFAYKNKEGNEVVLGAVLYLGVNDDGSRYYEIDKPEPKEENPEPKNQETEPNEEVATE